jgi:1-deoxy-D-xylulose-5-phosphate synthase
MAPIDGAELKQMLEFAIKYQGPSAIRYPRGNVPENLMTVSEVNMGNGIILRDGTDIALLAIGSCVIPALNAAKKLARDGINAAVINARFIKPLDRELIVSIASRIPKIVTIEENNLQGGFGSSVLECLNDSGITVKVRRLGIPDRFVEQGHPDRLRAKYGLDEEGIYFASLSFLREPVCSI